MSSYQLTHLKQLEAESIHIIREVAAEFENPCDVVFQSARIRRSWCTWLSKLFTLPSHRFHLLHVDTTWKFQEMYKFREEYAKKELGLDVLTSRQPRRLEAGTRSDGFQRQAYDGDENRRFETGVG